MAAQNALGIQIIKAKKFQCIEEAYRWISIHLFQKSDFCLHLEKSCKSLRSVQIVRKRIKNLWIH